MFTLMRMVSNSFKVFCRVVALVLAIDFLNCSIDGRDRNPDFVAEDLRYNDIETFAEFLAEVVLDCENTFQEQDEKDDESGRSFDFYQYYFSKSGSLVNKVQMYLIAVEFNIPASQFIPYVSRDVIAPPPKV
jgi:hypothetical protein